MRNHFTVFCRTADGFYTLLPPTAGRRHLIDLKSNMKHALLLCAALWAATFIPLSELNASPGFGAEKSLVATITGVIRDDATKEPLIGVNILVEGTTSGTVTGVDGDYSVSAEPGDVLIISYLGYQTRRITVGNRTNININLKEDANQLDEVVVVGYGSTVRSDVTGSLSSIGEETLREVPVTGWTKRYWAGRLGYRSRRIPAHRAGPFPSRSGASARP